MRKKLMSKKPKTSTLQVEPCDYQPTKAEMEEVIAIEATPDGIAAAVLRGGAQRRDASKSESKDLKPNLGSR